MGFPDLSFAGILPKAVVLAALGYGGVAYFGAGPLVAERVLSADVLPICEARIQELATDAARARIATVRAPAIDPSKTIAAATLNALRDSPLMQQLEALGGGLNDALALGDLGSLALGQAESEIAAANDVYERSIASIRDEMSIELSRAGSTCGCLAEVAANETRSQWAVFAGTLSLVKPDAVNDIDQRMERLYRAGACTGGVGGSS